MWILNYINYLFDWENNNLINVACEAHSSDRKDDNCKYGCFEGTQSFIGFLKLVLVTSVCYQLVTGHRWVIKAF